MWLNRLYRSSCTTVILLAGCSPAPNDDQPIDSGAEIRDHVTFYGVGKVARRQQQMDSSLDYLGPLFFAEIFIANTGTVSDASVRFPGSGGDTRDLDFRHSESEEIGDVMYLSGGAENDEQLEQNYPSVGYEFTFTTPAGRVDRSPVSFEGGSFPTPPVIIFEQGGKQIAFDQVDASRELTITWPPFAEGRADPNGILDDLIFVAIDSCVVEDIVHSGRPFEKDDYLTFRASDYRVSANTLDPGQSYSMYVEHALLPNTQNTFGMPAFATFASSTYMDFQTVGQTDPAYCAAATE